MRKSKIIVPELDPVKIAREYQNKSLNTLSRIYEVSPDQMRRFFILNNIRKNSKKITKPKVEKFYYPKKVDDYKPLIGSKTPRYTEPPAAVKKKRTINPDLPFKWIQKPTFKRIK